MRTLYEATITEIGTDVPFIIEEHVVIFFDVRAPKELHDVAVVHQGGALHSDIAAGDTFLYNGTRYRVIFVGDTANASIRDLGHYTLNFTGDTSETLPGSIYVEKADVPELKPGAVFKFVRE
ncbi:PTS glucitol/sorbitol transporter subunit IIA [Paenibacillus ginsengihumi]|uniref:PTS glucitol/sorbitol transporter subunit IIA n=1 Tax=Paenibacillus ginsengihumi TaxID=431596 RepID=UPI00036912C8|nr:PTS glucitol/sorbitol transporter subunit IIA [Paenibacillus ginsengihumi]